MEETEMKIALRNKPTKTQGRSLYLDFYDNGRRWYEFLNLFLTGDRQRDKETMRLAEGILSQRRLDAAATQNALPAPSRMKADFIAYCREIGETKITKSSRILWKRAVAYLESFAGKEGITFAGVNDALLENYKDYLLTKVSANSANVYLSKIKSACRKAAKHQILTHHVGMEVTIRKQRPLPKYLTFEEIQKLQATPISNQSVRGGFLFACFSGLRYSDVKALRWDQVRYEDSQPYIWFTQEKTGEAQSLPLSEQAVEILNAQKDIQPSPSVRRQFEKDTVFKLPLSSQAVNDALKRWAKQAGIEKNISFHVGRHSFATLSLTYGVDLYTVSKLLGHQSIQTTEIYAKVIDKTKRDAVNMLPKLQSDNQERGMK